MKTFSYVYVKKKDTEISELLEGRSPLIFRLRGTRPPFSTLVIVMVRNLLQTAWCLS